MGFLSELAMNGVIVMKQAVTGAHQVRPIPGIVRAEIVGGSGAARRRTRYYDYYSTNYRG